MASRRRWSGLVGEKNVSFDRDGVCDGMGLAQMEYNPYIAVENNASKLEKPYIVKDVEQAQVVSRSRVKTWHVLFLTVMILFVGAQLVMMETALNGLHYEIEKTKYEVDLLRGENDAHYQHLSELSQIDRLKQILSTVEGLELDSSRIFRLK